METKKIATRKLFEEFFACPSCGRAICREKRRYLICQSCGRALCEESKIDEFDDNYCGNCGAEVASVKKEALALAGEAED